MLPRENSDELAADVLVIGGGGSGLAAAISAAETGAKVLLLEKNGRLGGTTGLSIGSITATGTDLQKQAAIQDSPQEHFEDMALFAGELAAKDNVELRRILVENVPDVIRWLTTLGVCFFGPMPEPPHRKPRMHNVLPNSRAYIYYLRRECRRLGVIFKLNARAKEFVLRDERVTGVLVTIEGQSVFVQARRGVVLASGDYSGGQELKARYAPPLADVDAINPANTGDGQLMGLKLGSIILNGELIAGPHLRFEPPPTTSFFLKLPPWRPLTVLMRTAMKYAPSSLLRPFILSFVTTFLAPEPAMFREGAILLNKRGQRFTDELDKPGLDIPHQPGRVAYILFDRKLAKKFSEWPHFISTAPGLAYAYLPDYRRNRKDIYHEGSTLQAIAEKLKMPSDTLANTISRYNKEGTSPAGKRSALSEPPFVALGPVRSWVVLTDGGLKVTADHKVMRGDGSIVHGLFAAGSAGQGGLLLEGHGHHIGWALTSGRRAGRNAARNAPVISPDTSLE